MIKYLLVACLILFSWQIEANAVDIQAAVAAGKKNLEETKLAIWVNFGKGNYSEMRVQAERCMSMTYDAPDVTGLTDKEAFENYPKYIMASDFAECLYLKGLALEKQNNCEGIVVYQGVMKQFPTIWTGWPGTPWQPAQAAREGFQRMAIRILEKRGLEDRMDGVLETCDKK